MDAEIRALVSAGRHDDAATALLRNLGDELLRFLVHTCRDEEVAADVFSTAAEDIWRGLPSFRWESSLRTWIYCITRHAWARHRRKDARRREVEVARLEDLGSLSEIVGEIRSHTLSIIRTERRTKLDQLRDELTIEERMLLSLRIERELSWRDIALVLAESEPEDPATSARLRKRFQLLKDRLKRRGRELGLLASGG